MKFLLLRRSQRAVRSMKFIFCTASDGVRIAYALAGNGPPLVKAANWLNHLEYDWQSPFCSLSVARARQQSPADPL